jgi:hypothetical protein
MCEGPQISKGHTGLVRKLVFGHLYGITDEGVGENNAVRDM